MPWQRILISTVVAVVCIGTLSGFAQAVYDVPKLGDIKIDGSDADWGDRGFRVDALTQSTLAVRPRKEFSARVRLGWNDSGLLILVSVTDPHDEESASLDSLYDGDCVELFMATSAGARDVWQLLVAPGVSDRFPQLRTSCFDSRKSEELKKTPLEAQVQRIKTADGYQIEALMPWKMLGISPEVGQEIGFQIYVDDLEGRQNEPSHAMWYPKLGANQNTKLMQKLRLAEKASPPAGPVVWGGFEKFHDARINILSAPELSGKKVEIRQEGSDNVLAAGEMKTDEDRAMASLTLPMPPRGTVYKPLNVTVDGQPVATIDLGNSETGRADAIARLALAFSPAIFAGEKFPPADVSDPTLARDLLGVYTIKTTFYDRMMNKVDAPAAIGRYGAIVEITTEDGKTQRRFITIYKSPKPRTEDSAMTDEGIDPAVAKHFWQSLAENPRRPGPDRGDLAMDLSALLEMPPGEKRVFTDHWNPRTIDQQYWYLLQKKTGTLTPYQYLSWTPASYDVDQHEKWPLLIVLHGSSGRGDDLEMLRKRHEVPSNLTSNPDKLQFIVIGPQCPRGDWWRSVMVEDLIDRVQEKYRVDPDRIYVIGFSMGGYGTWDLGMTIPDRLAAIAPAAGGADPADAPLLKNLPVWIWHGDHDPSVKFEYSSKMFAALSAMGARTRFTQVAGGVHENDTAYEPELYRWLLEQKRGEPKQQPTTQPVYEQPAR